MPEVLPDVALVTHRQQKNQCSSQTLGMRYFRPNPDEHPENTAGEGWLVNSDQHKVVQFLTDAPNAHGQWVILRTFHWRPPDYPIPQTRRRMLRHNAIEAWETMLKTGWQRCSPPVR